MYMHIHAYKISMYMHTNICMYIHTYLVIRGLWQHTKVQIVAQQRRTKHHTALNAQNAQHISDHCGRGGGGQREQRYRRELHFQKRKGFVVGSEIMTPLAAAVRLINHKSTQEKRKEEKEKEKEVGE